MTQPVNTVHVTPAVDHCFGILLMAHPACPNRVMECTHCPQTGCTATVA